MIIELEPLARAHALMNEHQLARLALAQALRSILVKP
jgi:hypothetical protein